MSRAPDGGSGLRRSRRQFELSTITSFDGLLVALAFGALLAVWADSRAWGLAEPVATLALAAWLGWSIVLAHRSVRAAAPGSGELIAYGVGVVLTCAALVAVTDSQDLYREGAGAFFLVLAPPAGAFGVLALSLPWRRLAGWGLGAAALVGVGFAARGMDVIGVVVLVVYAIVAVGAGISSGAFTAWMLEVIRRLDAAREAQARLAVAEERLRFSRDLHDVYGRTLSTIAMTSELAATLAERGDDRAAAQMRAVHDLAGSALQQVRGIVTGYREISLDAEVSGARSILQSAGADLTVTGLAQARDALGPASRTALAWVVREAVTNVIRHSRARHVRLDAAVVDGELVDSELVDSELVGGAASGTATAAGRVVRVRITNDGPATEPAHAPLKGAAGGTGGTGGAGGTGLRGLSERLAAVGGRVDAGPTEGGAEFTVVAWLPCDER